MSESESELRAAAERLIDMLDSSPETAAFIAGRYSGLDHAIDLVRRNLTQTDDGAATPPADSTGAPTPAAAESATKATPSSSSSTVHDRSGRCSAEVCFPTKPYQHVRCLGHPGHDLPHTAATSAPTSHADFGAVVTVDLIWWGTS